MNQEQIRRCEQRSLSPPCILLSRKTTWIVFDCVKTAHILCHGTRMHSCCAAECANERSTSFKKLTSGGGVLFVQQNFAYSPVSDYTSYRYREVQKNGKLPKTTKRSSKWMTDLCEGGMEDLWSIAVVLLQVWFSVMIGFIMIPAMFGLSLGVTSVYIQILVKILEWATLRIERGHRERPTLPVPAPLPFGLIQREGGSMEQEMGELRRYRTQSISRGEFSLSDSFYFYIKGLESIVDDQVTQRFSSEELVSWNLLTRTNHNFHYISLRLTIIWGLGVIIRYCVLFPLRITLAIIGLTWLVIGTTLVGFLPNHRLKNWLSELVHLMCYRICARGLSATIQYHNKENKPQKGGICVANHTSPIDIVILANDGCYAMVGQSHGGLMGVIQRSMVRSCPHVWFERSEMRDRNAVTSRLRAHVAAKTNLPILIFPEGTCINNTSVMMFKKGSFEIGGTIYPVAIKYDPRFGDAFWNSAKYNMVNYLLRMMTSWAIVVNVWYLPPMTRREGEDAAQFANRVKSAIAHQGGLLDMAWDGSLKRAKVKEEFKEQQQKMYSSMVMGKKGRNSQEPHTESTRRQ